VRDDSGAVLPGVRVELAGDRVMGVQAFTTDDRGQFRFNSLPPGQYELTFTLAGFGTTKRTDVRVRVGATIDEDVTLKVAGQTEAVTVKASEVVVDTTSTKVETTYDREWIDSSPNQRKSFMDILASAPGVDPAQRGNDLQPASYGSNVDQNLYQLDGVNVSDHFNGNSNTLVQPSIDTIEQIEVLSLGAPAEYGDHEGAVFNIVTRQGTNKFRGGTAFYYQSNGLTGRNTTQEFDEGNPFTRVYYHNVTAHLGGPIVNDRLWFFTAYERLRDSSAEPTVPADQAGGDQLDHYLGKLNFQLKPGQQFTGVVNFDRSRHDDGLFPGQAPETAEGTGRRTLTTSVAYSGAVKHNTVVEAQYAGYYVDHKCCGAGGGKRVVGTRFENLDTGDARGATFGWYEYDTSRTSINGKVSHHADDFLGGGHDFKFGVQYSNAPVDGLYGVNDRVYTSDFQTGYGYNYTPYFYGGTVRTVGAFADDSFQVGERLQFNVGLRYDNTKARFTDQPVSDELGNRTDQIVRGYDVYSWNTVAPRIGFNLKLTKDGRTALKGHYGRYYRAGNTGEWSAATSPTRVQSLFGDWNFQTSTFESVVVNSTPSNARVDSNIVPARTDQFTVSLERELFQTLNLAATVVVKRGRNLSNWEEVGGIYAPVPYVDDTGAEASGRTISVLQLQNDRGAREFLLTTGLGTRADVNAFSLSATKRMSSKWQLTSSFTVQKATSDHIFGDTAQLNFREYGRDPNNYINSKGLAVRDRRVLAKTQFLYAGLPLGLTLAVDWNYLTGYPTQRQVRVAETGLNSTVQTAPRATDKRFESIDLLNLRLQKDIRIGKGGARLAVIANLFNALNGNEAIRFRSDLATAEIYHAPREVLAPRRLMLGTKFDF
jgi:outer membrane receptor protein involved in Fe transport